MTPEEFAAKVHWEGGVIDALEYGLKAEDMDGSDPGLQTKWAVLVEQYAKIEPLVRKMELLLEELVEEEE